MTAAPRTLSSRSRNQALSIFAYASFRETLRGVYPFTSFRACPERSEGAGSEPVEMLRGACPEREQILRFAQNDTERRAQSDKAAFLSF